MVRVWACVEGDCRPLAGAAGVYACTRNRNALDRGLCAWDRPHAQLLSAVCLCSLACLRACLPAISASVIEKLRGQLVSMKKSASGDEAFKTCVSTQLKYISNVARAPDDDKFRSINMGNAAFQSRVASVPGAVDFFKLMGFQVGARVWACVLVWGARLGSGCRAAEGVVALSASSLQKAQ